MIDPSIHTKSTRSLVGVFMHAQVHPSTHACIDVLSIPYVLCQQTPHGGGPPPHAMQRAASAATCAATCVAPSSQQCFAMRAATCDLRCTAMRCC
eukprot:356541-Chlamydomonas_euryale.AAC.2